MEATRLNRLTEQIWAQLCQPTALLVGDRPPITMGYHLTDAPPYDGVIIGSLSSGELLHFSNAAVLDALLVGKPVYLWVGGLPQYRATKNTHLLSKLITAENQLKQLGIRFYGGSSKPLVTATTAKILANSRQPLPPGAIITPMAQDILGGYTS